MREIKFRAWVNGEMLAQPVDTPYGLSKIMGFLDSQGINEFDKVMQYTGLKDKNGKEIYEGDIIDNLIVSYVGDVGESLGMNCGFYLQRDNFESFTELECIEDYEVTGNIYENPELTSV